MKKKFKEAIGIGDVCFFVIMAMSFPTLTFSILFSASLIFATLLFLILKPKMNIKTVPLAGLQALFLLLVNTFNMMFNFVNLYTI